MSDPAARHLVVPVSSDLADGRATVGMETGAGVRQVRRNPLEQDFDERDDTLSMQLAVGRRPTKITSGDYAPDGRLVAGTVDDLVTVARKADEQQGTRSRGAPPPAGPTGVAALRGDALVATPQGLARLDGVVASGGYPRSELDAAAQGGGVPGAIDALARVATWSAEGEARGWAMPLRIKLAAQGAAPPGAPTGVGPFRVVGSTTEQFVELDPRFGGTPASDPSLSALGATHASGVRVVQVATGATVRRFGGGTAYQGQSAGALKQAVEYSNLLNSLGETQRAVIENLFAAQQRRAGEAAAGQVTAATDAQVRRYRAELDRVNESLAALGANVSGSLGGYDGEPTARDAVEDATASGASARVVEVWGALEPYDLLRRDALSEDYRGRDPESYQDRARLAPRILIDVDKLLGDDRPPPPFPPPEDDEEDEDGEEEEDGKKPKHPDPEDGPEEEIIDGRQARRPFEPESDPEVFVPGEDTFIPGTGLPDPGSTVTGEAGTEGKLIKWCPLADPAEDEPGIGWVPSPTGEPTGTGVGAAGAGTTGTTGGDGSQVGAGTGAALVGGGVGGFIAGLPSGPAGGALTPGAAAGLLLEDGSRINLVGGVPSLSDLTDGQRSALVDMTLPAGIARVPSPIGVLRDHLSIKALLTLYARQINGLTDIVQAALVGGRYSYYAGNLGIVNTNQRGLGIADQFIGQHLVDPDDQKTIPAALHTWQQVDGKRRGVRVTSPTQKVERITTGEVVATGPVSSLVKSPGPDAQDTGPWIQATARDGSHPVEVSNGGKGYFAEGTSGDHYHLQDVSTVENVDGIDFPVKGAKLDIQNDAGSTIGSLQFSKRGSTAKLSVTSVGGGKSEIAADKVTADVIDPYAIVMDPVASKPFELGTTQEPGFWVKTDGLGTDQHEPRYFDGTNDHAIALGSGGLQRWRCMPCVAGYIPPSSWQAAVCWGQIGGGLLSGNPYRLAHGTEADGSARSSYVEITYAIDDGAHQWDWTVQVPPDFTGWDTNAIRVRHRHNSMTSTGTLDYTLTLTVYDPDDGSALATDTHSATGTEATYSWITIASSALGSSFVAGDLLHFRLALSIVNQGDANGSTNKVRLGSIELNWS